MVKKKTAFSFSLLLALAGLLISGGAAASPLLAAATGDNPRQVRQAMQEGRNMSQIQTAAVANLQKPPIDLALPAPIATATFALG